MNKFKKIICIGDSNTYGYDPRDFFGNPYPLPWPDILAGLSGSHVINLGENGAEIPHRQEFLIYLRRKLDRLAPFDLLIIMLGSNDILNSYIFNVNDISERMEGLLCFLKDSYPVSILLLSPPKMTREEQGKDSFRKETAETFESLAEKYGIRFVDTALWNLELSFDGVHLTEMDHKEFAKQVYDQIMMMSE